MQENYALLYNQHKSMQDAMKSSFLLWKSLHFRSVLQREEQKQWSIKCAREAFCQWQNFTKQKKKTRICENIIAHKLMLILFGEYNVFTLCDCLI